MIKFVATGIINLVIIFISVTFGYYLQNMIIRLAMTYIRGSLLRITISLTQPPQKKKKKKKTIKKQNKKTKAKEKACAAS